MSEAPHADISTLVIREVSQDDSESLTAALSPDVTPQQVAHRIYEALRSRRRRMLIAEVDGSPVGTVSSDMWTYAGSDAMRLFALDVGPKWRSKGIGRALVREVESQARSSGFRKVMLEVALDNTGALRLYERLGYRRAGRPFINSWTKLTEDGGIEMVEESARMEKSVSD